MQQIFIFQWKRNIEFQLICTPKSSVVEPEPVKRSLRRPVALWFSGSEVAELRQFLSF